MGNQKSIGTTDEVKGSIDYQGIFDSLYSRLLLRDIFGKVVPGSVVLFTMGISVKSINEVRVIISELPLGAWLLLFGASWLVAFSIQGFGERIGPKKKKDDGTLKKNYKLLLYYSSRWEHDYYLKMRSKFNKKSTNLQKQQLERHVVIKEACGNGYLAISISIIYTIVDIAWRDGLQVVLDMGIANWPLCVMLFVGTFFLALMHFEQAELQSKYMKHVVDKKK